MCLLEKHYWDHKLQPWSPFLLFADWNGVCTFVLSMLIMLSIDRNVCYTLRPLEGYFYTERACITTFWIRIMINAIEVRLLIFLPHFLGTSLTHLPFLRSCDWVILKPLTSILLVNFVSLAGIMLAFCTRIKSWRACYLLCELSPLFVLITLKYFGLPLFVYCCCMVSHLKATFSLFKSF